MITKQYKIRSGIVFIFFMFAYVCVMINLYIIQIKKRSFYSQLGEKQYHVTVTQLPPRAPIYDRSGRVCLALNKESLSAFILPRSLEQRKELEHFLSKHFPQALERLKNTRTSYFMYIKRRLSDTDLINIQASGLSDIKLLHEPSRFYPIESAGQIVGVTDIDNKGLFGIEMQFNDRLAGTPSTYMLEKDARSGRFYFEKKTTIQGKMGQPVTLTIDSDLQFLTREELRATVEKYNAKEGSALIMDPDSGEILAIVNYPDFDPNTIDQIENLELAKNKAITEVYELGSVIKTCSALAALEEGVVSMNDPIDCENKITTYFEGRKINTVPQSVAGIIPFAQVIKKSNNIGIAKVAKRLDKKIYTYYKLLGFGTKTGIEFPGEQKGFLNHPNNWSKQSIISLSYGYELSLSLLQLARAYSIIANGGFDVIPQLILDPAPPKIVTPHRLFSAHNIQTMQDILKLRHPDVQGYTLMSKTGTANTLVNGLYDPTKNLFTCAGIVEKGTYRRTIVVFIKEVAQHGMYAATVAGPLFERVAKKVLIHDRMI
jgi:cell division protein FtsI (penicillin-binding protein 3)